jgi:ABC-type uncharacterized transport system substrate-binding protein
MKFKTFFLTIYFSFIFQIFSNETKSVTVLISTDNRIYEQALYGIQSVSDFKLDVQYLDVVLSEYPDLSLYFNSFEKEDTPFIITIGPRATRTAIDYLIKTPIVFTMVNSPKTLGLNQDNICGVSMDISISEYFQTLKEIDPKIKNVYSFYSTSDGEYSTGEGDYSDLKYKLFFYKKKLLNKNDFTKELNELINKADAFLISNDPLFGKKEFEELSKFAKENKIITMTSFPALVKVGATFGISPDYSKIGVMTGHLSNRIGSKTSTCSEEMVYLPDHSYFYVNDSYAKESGIQLPEAIIERAKLSKLFDVGVNFLKENKLNSAKVVFDSVLKKDPGNKTAFSYQQLIIDKLSGAKTKDLLDSAETHMKYKRFPQARIDYQKALNINPNIIIAKEGIQNSLSAQSEMERSIAIDHAKSGRIFDAVRMFNASIATQPSNTKAISDLSNHRTLESANMPAYIKKGIKMYDEREYENAIEVFENALLIVPGNKEVIEYLRLSKKKQEAIKTLKKKLGI